MSLPFLQFIKPSTYISYTFLLLTPQLCSDLFTYFNMLPWSLYSYTLHWALAYSTFCTLARSLPHTSTLYWSLSHSSTLRWSFYLLLYLTLVSFLLLYLVLVFLLTLIPFTCLFLTPIPCVGLLSTPIPYNGLFLTPLPCAGFCIYSSTLHWSLSHPSSSCWSF